MKACRRRLTLLTRSSPNQISPESAPSSNPRRFRSVLLPDPDGPVTARYSPGLTSRSRPLSTTTGAPTPIENVLVSPMALIIAAALTIPGGSPRPGERARYGTWRAPPPGRRERAKRQRLRPEGGARRGRAADPGERPSRGSPSRGQEPEQSPRRPRVQILEGQARAGAEHLTQQRILGEPEVPRGFDADDGEAIRSRERPLQDPDDDKVPAVQREARPRPETPRGGEVGPHDHLPPIPAPEKPSGADGKLTVVAVGHRHAQVEPQDQLLGQGQELGGDRIEREHHLGLDCRHPRDGQDLLELPAWQQAAAGEARAHSQPLPRHRDLPQDEAVAALDEDRKSTRLNS